MLKPFLESIKDEIAVMEAGTAKVFDGLPLGVGQVLSKNAAWEIVKTATSKVKVIRVVKLHNHLLNLLSHT